MQERVEGERLNRRKGRRATDALNYLEAPKTLKWKENLVRQRFGKGKGESESDNERDCLVPRQRIQVECFVHWTVIQNANLSHKLKSNPNQNFEQITNCILKKKR